MRVYRVNSSHLVDNVAEKNPSKLRRPILLQKSFLMKPFRSVRPGDQVVTMKLNA